MSIILAQHVDPSSRSHMKVILANTDAERELVYRLRYTIYVEEMGLLSREHPFVDEGRKRVIDPFDAYSANLLLLVDDVPAGTVRVTRSTDGELEVASYRDMTDVLMRDRDVVEVTRLMVLRSQRRGVAGPLLFKATYAYCRQAGIRVIVAADKVGNLGRYYRNIGLEQVDNDLFEYALVGSARYALLRCDIGQPRSFRGLRWSLTAVVFSALVFRLGSIGHNYFRRNFKGRTRRAAPRLLAQRA